MIKHIRIKEKKTLKLIYFYLIEKILPLFIYKQCFLAFLINSVFPFNLKIKKFSKPNFVKLDDSYIFTKN